MRRYQLTINGKTYTVLVSELSSERFAVQLDGREFEVQVTESGEVSEILPRQPLPPLSRQLLPPQFLHRQHLFHRRQRPEISLSGRQCQGLSCKLWRRLARKLSVVSR